MLGRLYIGGGLLGRSVLFQGEGGVVKQSHRIFVWNFLELSGSPFGTVVAVTFCCSFLSLCLCLFLHFISCCISFSCFILLSLAFASSPSLSLVLSLSLSLPLQLVTATDLHLNLPPFLSFTGPCNGTTRVA